MKRAKSTPKAKSAPISRGPIWTERVKTVLDGTNSAHLISESATLKATLALPLNLALPIANSDLAQQGLLRATAFCRQKGRKETAVFG